MGTRAAAARPLAAFKQRYRRAGFLVDTHGELTDYLPMVLEFAARVDPVAGPRPARRVPGSIELIRLALQEAARHTPTSWCRCATLPGQSPPDKAAALAMQRGPAGDATDPMPAGTVEQVGLDVGDPRLISLSPVVTAPPATVGAAMNVFLWSRPYLALISVIGGTIWRFRYDKFGWTTRSSELYEARLLRIGSPLFHYGVLVVIAGHAVGLVIPESWTNAPGDQRIHVPLGRSRRRDSRRRGHPRRRRDPDLPAAHRGSGVRGDHNQRQSSCIWSWCPRWWRAPTSPWWE